MRIRSAAVAGTFYPQSAQQLQTEIHQLLKENKRSNDVSGTLKALIVPHAGYIYSGAIAATAYNILKNSAHNIHRVILLGPSHRVALRGMAMSDCDVFTTPLGNIALDTNALKDLQTFANIKIVPEAHTWEHSLEVQLPFLQSVLNDFLLIPLVVGLTSADEVAQLLEPFWQDQHTLIVISSDLSHYLTYQQAKEQDSDTSRLIESKYFQLHGEQACGCYPLNGLLKLTSNQEVKIVTLDQRNSGDTAGDRNRVVGYGAYAVYQ